VQNLRNGGTIFFFLNTLTSSYEYNFYNWKISNKASETRLILFRITYNMLWVRIVQSYKMWERKNFIKKK